MNYRRHFIIRKTHRYLGLFIGIQFLLWSVGGLYFSWTNIDKIHGDHFRNMNPEPATIPLSTFKHLPDSSLQIRSLEIRDINQTTYLWINDELLINAQTGQTKDSVSKEEALAIASKHILPEFQVKEINYVSKVEKHHEYRGLPLPVWAISYTGDHNLKAYVDVKGGKFQRVRYDSWRIFDFLWMLHVMDYDGRDDINNWVLRIFSILGICSILSGFLLYVISSGSLRRLKKSIKRKSA